MKMNAIMARCVIWRCTKTVHSFCYRAIISISNCTICIIGEISQKMNHNQENNAELILYFALIMCLENRIVSGLSLAHASVPPRWNPYLNPYIHPYKAEWTKNDEDRSKHHTLFLHIKSLKIGVKVLYFEMFHQTIE